MKLVHEFRASISLICARMHPGVPAHDTLCTALEVCCSNAPDPSWKWPRRRHIEPLGMPVQEIPEIRRCCGPLVGLVSGLWIRIDEACDEPLLPFLY